MRDRLSVIGFVVQAAMPLSSTASLHLLHVTPKGSWRQATPGRSRAGGSKQDVHAKALGQLDARFRDEAQVHLVYLQDQQKLQDNHSVEALSTSKDLWAQTSSHYEVGTEGYPEHDSGLA